jgi:hypothetical protein
MNERLMWREVEPSSWLCEWEGYKATVDDWGDGEWRLMVYALRIKVCILHGVGESIITTDLDTAQRLCETIMRAHECGIGLHGHYRHTEGELE